MSFLTAPQLVDDLWPAGVPVHGSAERFEPPLPATQDKQYARMFELSHSYGPLIGLLLCLGLAISGFPLDYRLAGFALLVSAFWLYPPILRRTSRYRLLSLCSLHHLTFVILWASHGYGGLTSPFLLWFAVVPLLGFLYLPPRLGLWLGLVLSLTLSMGVFIVVCVRLVAPPAVPVGMLEPMALLSIFGASAYVAMMSVYLGRVLASRRELQQQAESHRDAAAQLARVAGEIHRSSAEKLTMIRRLAKGSSGPVEYMHDSSASLVAETVAEGDGQELESITEAVSRLRTLIADTDHYAELEGATELHPERTVVASLVDEAADRIRPLMGGTANVIVHGESGAAGEVWTHPRLLVDAIVYVGRQLVLDVEGRNLVLHAERMLAASAEHLVIDIALESADDLAAPTVTILDAQALKRPSSGKHAGGCGLSLALAHRICTLLGGNLLAAGPADESMRFRILVPVAAQTGRAGLRAA